MKMRAVPQSELHRFIVGKLYDRWELVEAALNGVDRRKKPVDLVHDPIKDFLDNSAPLQRRPSARAIGGAPFSTGQTGPKLGAALARRASSLIALNRSESTMGRRQGSVVRALSAEPSVSAVDARLPDRPSTVAAGLHKHEGKRREEKRMAAEQRLIAEIASELSFAAANSGVFDSDAEDDAVHGGGQESCLAFDDVTQSKAVFFKAYHDLADERASVSGPSASAARPTADTAADEAAAASPFGIRAAARAYLSACERLGLAPRPIIVPRNGRDDKLNFAHYGITDAMMQAIAAALPFMTQTRELNVEHNSIDRDGCAALSQCLGALKIECLNLSHSRGISRGIDSLAHALHDLRAHTLKRLVLSHSKLPVRSLTELFRALAWSNCIVELVLSHCELDDHCGYELSLALPRMKTLRLLDLGWNCLRRKHLGAALRDWNVKLETLILAHNSLGATDAAEEVASALAENAFLTSLDLSFNRITSSVCGALERALASNRTLTSLDIGGNPVGCAGARALMHIMQMGGRGVSTHIDMRGCNLSKRDGDSFDPAAPAGAYSLLMSHSQDQMRARELLRLAWDGRVGAWKWIEVRLNDRAYALPAAQPGAMPEVDLPIEGKLDFVFVDNVSSAVPLEPTDWKAKLRMLQRMKVSGGDEAQRDAARLLSADLSLNAVDAVEFLKGISDPSVQHELFERMLPQLVDADLLHVKLGAAFGDGVLRLRAKLGRHFYFHPDWPNGHYELNLDAQLDRSLAQLLFRKASALRALHISTAACDTSQAGDQCPWRNVRLDGRPYRINWAALDYSQALPKSGRLCFDYSTTERPKCKAMSDGAFDALVREWFPDGWQASVVNGTASWKYWYQREFGVCNSYALRGLFFTCDQLLQLVRRIPFVWADRPMIAAALFPRVVDLGGFGRVAAEMDRPLDWTRLLKTPQPEASAPEASAVVVDSVAGGVDRDGARSRSSSIMQRALDRVATIAARKAALQTVTRLVVEADKDVHVMLPETVQSEVEMRNLLSGKLDLLRRLGVLNAWTPQAPDGFLILDLALFDDRRCCEMLIKLATSEPGENWIGETFAGKPVQLPQVWKDEVPREGVLTCCFVSVAGAVDAQLREKLAAQTLTGAVVRSGCASSVVEPSESDDSDCELPHLRSDLLA